MSMKYDMGQKFIVTDQELIIEIVSKRPGSQGIHINEMGTNYYDVMINGNRTLLSEPIIDLILKQKKEEKKIPIETVLIEEEKKEIVKTKESIIPIDKPRRGRPSKK